MSFKIRAAIAVMFTLAMFFGGCNLAIGQDEPVESSQTHPADVEVAATMGSGDELVEQYALGVRTRRLDNGLVLITKENSAAPVASVFVMLRAGSLFEREFLGAGISHVAEHLVAGGTTTKRSELEIQKTLADIGAVSNAYTSMDRTAYFINTIPEHVPEAVGLLSDYMMNAVIEQEEFNRELEVVQREITTGADNPGRQVYYLLNETMFPNMPQGLRVIGYEPNLRPLTRDNVWTYYRRMYVPSNAVVVAAGDFDGAEVMDQLAKAFGQWEGPRVRPTVLPDPTPPVTDLVAVKEMETQLAHVMMAFHTVSISHPDLYALDVLAGILGQGDSSRLAADLHVQRNLVHGISAWNHTPSYPGGQFAFYYTSDPERIEQVRGEILAHIERLAENPPTADELAKVKTQVVSRTVLGQRTADAQARSLAADQLHLEDPFFSARYASNMQKVTVEDVQRVARQYLQGKRSVTAVVRPPEAASEKEIAVRTETTRSETFRKVLDDTGLTLLVYRTPGQPAVSMLAAMKAGQSVETDETAGITNLASRFLTRGTATRSEQELAEYYDRIGGSIGADSGWNTLYLQSLVMKSDFEQSFEVFSDVLMNAAFSDELLESTQQRQKASLAQMMSDAWGPGRAFFLQKFFNQGSPYAYPQQGTTATIDSISTEQLREFYRRVRSGRNMVLTVAGDVDPEAVERMVRRALADLPAGEPLNPHETRDVEPRKVEDVEIHINQTEQRGAVVFVGYPGTTLFNVDDIVAMDVYNTIIAGYYMPRGWLHSVLRGQGLVYAVHFGGRPGLLPGYYASQALTEPQQATRVARLLMDLVHSGRDYEFTEDDLAQARTIIISARRMSNQTPEQMALKMTLDELYGLGYDHEAKYTAKLQAVTIEQVRQAVQKYITPPVVTISTPQPDLVDQDELRRPYDAERLKELRERSPEVLPPQGHVAPGGM